jgi:glycosyltransferase involved in cell wall biosynthesis
MISKNDRYGAQRIFLDQVAVLHRMGHDVTVVCRGNEGFVVDSARALGVPYHGIPMKGLRDIFSLRQYVKKHNIDVIHTTLDRADHFGGLVARLAGVPAVTTMMVPRYHVGYRFARKVIVLSLMQRQLLLNKGVRADRITLVRPGIDVERFSRPDGTKRALWQQKLRTASYSIVLCHIASLIHRKAHMVSLDLIAAWKRRSEVPLLVIIGDPLAGAYYDALRSRIDELGIADNVVFTGWTADIPEILSLSHFTVLPSEGEALGVVLMEGMAAGTPVVARAGEGGAELIEEHDTGLLYRPDEGTMKLAEEMVAMRRDEARFAAIQTRCRSIAAERFSLRQFGEQLTSVYHEVSGIPRSPSRNLTEKASRT